MRDSGIKKIPSLRRDFLSENKIYYDTTTGRPIVWFFDEIHRSLG